MALAERHASGGVSDDRLDHDAIGSFADPRLADATRRAWEANGREAFRADLLALVREGRIAACLDLARGVALDEGAAGHLRTMAIEALAACGDGEGMEACSAWLACGGAEPLVASRFAMALFPDHLDIPGLIERTAPRPTRQLGGVRARAPRALEVLPGRRIPPRPMWRPHRPLPGTSLPPCHRRVSGRFRALTGELAPIARDALPRFAPDPAPNGVVRLLTAVERADRRAWTLDGDETAGASLAEMLDARRELKRRLFWADLGEVRLASDDPDRPRTLWQVSFHQPPLWRFDAADQDWLERDVRGRRLEDDRRIALDAIISLIVHDARVCGTFSSAEASHLRALVDDGGQDLAGDLHRFASTFEPGTVEGAHSPTPDDGQAVEHWIRAFWVFFRGALIRKRCATHRGWPVGAGAPGRCGSWRGGFRSARGRRCRRRRRASGG